MNSRIMVSGNIVGELSEKIPSNIIALNELIKNSYDAGASKVSVNLDTVAKTLMVIDDGAGMNKVDIDTLFHISKSIKKYGEVNHYGRYTQGSKGLGFLSVFKFGNKVTWKTRKDIGLTFSVDYEELLAADNISQFQIDVVEDNSIVDGTSIIISLDSYNAASLAAYFEVEKNYKKILNAFDDTEFEVELILDEKKHSSSDTTSLLDNSPEHQLYYITYNSKKQKLSYFYNGHEIILKAYPFTSSLLELSIELVVFQFPPYGKGKVDQLFLNPQNDLTPLLYVNSNLFNNYDLFDPNVMKNIKTTQVLNQMIGFIRIISNNSMINFNSDRSQFLQNELTDWIKQFLLEINKEIQITGSQNKKYLMGFDFLTIRELAAEYDNKTDNEEFRKFIKSDFAFKEKVVISKKSGAVKYSLFGKEINIPIRSIPKQNSGIPITTENGNKAGAQGGGNTGVVLPPSPPTSSAPVPAVISFNRNDVKIAVPSGQIDLKQYVASVYNSDGKQVEKSFLSITVDGSTVQSGVLPSVVSPCEKDIVYSYMDSKTALVAKSLHISFFQPASTIKGTNTPGLLISVPSRENYNIEYNVYVAKLIEQINSLNLTEYRELICCSLRAIFDLSIDSINKSTKFGTLFQGMNKFEDRVVKIVDYIKSNGTYVREISNAAKIDYHSLCNMLDTQKYQSGVSTAHLGAHKSAAYISESDVNQLAKLLGVFVVVVNEMLKNSKII